MKQEDKILDSENQIGRRNTKRNSCLLITAVVLVLLFAFAYVATKEVSNAFKLVDKGLAETNQTYEDTNEALKNVLLKHSEYSLTVEKIENISTKYNTLLDSTIQLLINQTGGWKQESNENELANPKNHGVPTKILVTDKLGEKLEQEISKASNQYNEILKVDLGIDTVQIPLKLRMDHIEKSSKTWTEYNFDQMPLMAVLPILRKFKNDEKESKSIIYRIMANEK